MPRVRVAVIDIGTNSTRLLVAQVEDGKVEELDRRTNVTRLGEGVDTSGRLSDAAIERVFATVEEYTEPIQRLDAERTIGIATSAVRDAENGGQFRDELAQRFGVEARTISGDQEARLTFLGATAARTAGEGPLLVLDIGGGSTEFVVGTAGEQPVFHVSTQAGSVRYTERFLTSDPPTATELGAAAAAMRAAIDEQVPRDTRGRVVHGLAVAGTATNLAAVDQALDPYDPAKVDGYTLTLAACERLLAELAALPIAERKLVTGLHPDRAPTIVAGVVILVESIKAFGLDSIETSEADILHGAALTAGGGWVV